MNEYVAKSFNWPSGSGGSGGGLVSFRYDGTPQDVLYTSGMGAIPLPVALFNFDTGVELDISTATKQDTQSAILTDIYNELNSSGNVVEYLDSTGNAQKVTLNQSGITGFNFPLPVGLYSNSSGNLFDPDTFVTKTDINVTNGYLSTLVSRTPPLGQAAMVASIPVTISNNQSAVDTTIRSSAGVKLPAASTTTPLGANAVYTSGWIDAIAYSAIQVGIYADQNSANLGVEIQFSYDAIQIDHYHQYTYDSTSNGTGYLFQPEFQYFRVKYTNGSVAQTTFTLLTIMRPTALFPSQYRVEQAITGQSQALVTKGVIYGQTTGGGGGYVAVKVNPSGALSTATTLDAGTNIIGKVGIDQTTNGTTNAVYVNNFPATQPVSGSVSVSNFPATQAVTGTFWQTTQPISGSVSVSNFPATQVVSGSVDITTPTPINVISNLAPTGSYAEITNLTTTAQTFTVPTGAYGFVLEALSTNTNNIRYKIGGTATTTSGMKMEPGRDTGYIPCSANISVCAEAGTNQAVSVQWIGDI